MIEVVYYPISDGLVFLKRGDALERAVLWKALNTARTWEGFRSMVSEENYEEAVKRVKENWTYPAPNDVFDTGQIDGYSDGDWPAQEMIDWISEDVQKRFGGIADSVHSGEFLCLPTGEARGIVQTMHGHGHRCEEDEELIERAHGMR